MNGLRGRLTDAELFKAFAAEFTREWNRLQAEASGDSYARQKELAKCKAQLERLLDALVNGAEANAVQRADAAPRRAKDHA